MADAPPQPMLRVEVITLFPRMVEGPLSESILGKAQQRGLLQVKARDLRPYGVGKHQVTDDVPYGGGPGMVMKPEPLVAAIEAARAELGPTAKVILLDPQGAPFIQSTAARLSNESALVFVCGRYEGVDERVRPFVDETLSLGDFVLTGGELAAVCMVDAIARLRPGVLGNDSSSTTESFAAGLLEGPQYTRPPDFRGALVPDILLSGDHAKIARWRLREALQRTRDTRPDALQKAELGDVARKLLRELPFPAGQGIGHAPEAVPGGVQGAPQGPLVPRRDGQQDERPGGSRSDGDGNARQGD